MKLLLVNLENNNSIKYDRLLILFGIFWAFFITISRALRWPNDWAEAQWLISYKFGFVKRGLPGTLIAPFVNLGRINNNVDIVIKIISTIFLLLFCAVLLWICLRIIQKSLFNIYSVLVVLIFSTSPFVVMSAHLNGYFDHIIVILVVFSCWALFNGKVWLISIILSTGILVHEITFLIGFPVVIFLALVQYIKETNNLNTKQLITGYFSRYKLLFLIPSVTLLIIIINQTIFIEPAELKIRLVAYLTQFDFIQDKRNFVVPNAFTTSFFAYFSQQGPMFMQRITDLTHLLHIGLPIIILLHYVWHNLSAIRYKKLIFGVLVAITLLPLSLHVIACDTSRIWSYPLLVAMLSLWGVTEILPANNNVDKEPFVFYIIGLILLISQIFILTPLMDGAQEQYSNGMRIILYSPTFIIFTIFILRYYKSKNSSF